MNFSPVPGSKGSFLNPFIYFLKDFCPCLSEHNSISHQYLYLRRTSWTPIRYFWRDFSSFLSKYNLDLHIYIFPGRLYCCTSITELFEVSSLWCSQGLIEDIDWFPQWWWHCFHQFIIASFIAFCYYLALLQEMILIFIWFSLMVGNFSLFVFYLFYKHLFTCYFQLPFKISCRNLGLRIHFSYHWNFLH